MSYSTLAMQVQDYAFMQRITAAVEKEAWNNPTFGDTDYGRAVILNYVSPPQQFGWPLSIANEATYEYAINAGTPNPGGDPTVITDADILSGVQANWPAEWPPPPADLHPTPTGP